MWSIPDIFAVYIFSEHRFYYYLHVLLFSFLKILYKVLEDSLRRMITWSLALSFSSAQSNQDLR